MKFILPLVFIGSFLLASCNRQTSPAVTCEVTPQVTQKISSQAGLTEIAGNAAGTCTASKQPVTSTVWVEFSVQLQKKSGTTWQTIVTQTPAQRKTINTGGSVAWTDAELRAVTSCTNGEWRTVVDIGTSTGVKLGFPRISNSSVITC
jgi:hypothetical protein